MIHDEKEHPVTSREERREKKKRLTQINRRSRGAAVAIAALGRQDAILVANVLARVPKTTSVMPQKRKKQSAAHSPIACLFDRKEKNGEEDSLVALRQVAVAVGKLAVEVKEAVGQAAGIVAAPAAGVQPRLAAVVAEEAQLDAGARPQEVAALRAGRHGGGGGGERGEELCGGVHREFVFVCALGS